MGFLDMFKGAPSGEKKQESNTWNNLDNVFKSSFSSGVDLGEKGKENTGVASSLFQGIAKGDRTALAPAVNAAVEGSDAAKREQGQMGTARGGGMAGENQQIQDHTRQLISSLLGEAQVGAADKLAAIGSGETNSMMAAEGVASGTESNLSSLLHRDVQEKEQSAAKMWGSLISGGLNIASGGLTGGLKGAAANI
jgi:hypothetical protein